MGKQSHFVVAVDEEGVAIIDYALSIHFDSGDVWDEDTASWFGRNEPEVSDAYEKAEEVLMSLVRQTWKEE